MGKGKLLANPRELLSIPTTITTAVHLLPSLHPSPPSNSASHSITPPTGRSTDSHSRRMATPALEKSPYGTAVNVTPLDVTLPPPRTNTFTDTILDTYRAFNDRRAALGLSNPGPVDEISKEVQRSVFLTNQAFSGLRAELNKSFSIYPLFQISHAFSTGSQMLSPYTFLALYGTDNVSSPSIVFLILSTDIPTSSSVKRNSIPTPPSPPASTRASPTASSSRLPPKCNRRRWVSLAPLKFPSSKIIVEMISPPNSSPLIHPFWKAV